MPSRLLIFAACLAVAAIRPLAAAEVVPFGEWLQGVRMEARAAGMSEAFLDTALAGVRPIARVIELDRRQPEFTLTFWKYLDKNVNDARIQKGRAMLARHRELLEKIGERYGVQPRF